MDKLRYRAVLTIIFGLILVSAASADEIDANVYEVLDDISVGSLFFTPAERERLDALRAGKAVPTIAKARSPRTRTNKSAAGFILRSNGESKVFRQGQFETGEPDQEMTFPGDVKIIRITAKADAKKDE